METKSKPQSSSTEELVQASKDASESAGKLFRSVKQACVAVEKVAREQVGKRPYAAMGVAAGAGFVVAGGLASTLTRRLVSTGTKVAALFIVDEVMDTLLAKRAAPAPAPSEPGKSGDAGAGRMAGVVGEVGDVGDNIDTMEEPVFGP